MSLLTFKAGKKFPRTGERAHGKFRLSVVLVGCVIWPLYGDSLRFQRIRSPVRLESGLRTAAQPPTECWTRSLRGQRCIKRRLPCCYWLLSCAGLPLAVHSQRTITSSFSGPCFSTPQPAKFAIHDLTLIALLPILHAKSEIRRLLEAA